MNRTPQQSECTILVLKQVSLEKSRAVFFFDSESWRMSTRISLISAYCFYHYSWGNLLHIMKKGEGAFLEFTCGLADTSTVPQHNTRATSWPVLPVLIFSGWTVGPVLWNSESAGLRRSRVGARARGCQKVPEGARSCQRVEKERRSNLVIAHCFCSYHLRRSMLATTKSFLQSRLGFRFSRPRP